MSASRPSPASPPCSILPKALPANLKTALHLDGAVGLAEKILPFFDISLGWVLPAFVGLVLGLVIHFAKKQKVA